MTTARKQVGDEVWVARCGQEQVTKTCPVCFGKRQVTLTLGDDSEMELPCEYCKLGYEGPRGVVNEYEWIDAAVLVRITEVRVKQSAGVEDVEYMCGHYFYTPDKVFDAKDEALERCKAEIAERELQQTTNASQMKKYKAKSFAWHAGYHMQEVKRAERDVEYHRKMAVACAARIPKSKGASDGS